MRASFLSLSVLLLAAAPAVAQQPGVPAPEAAQAQALAQTDAVAGAQDDVAVNQLIIYGSDPCPPSTGDQINVCARLPEDDRFRIPPNLRENPNDPRGQSWANRALELQFVGRTGIGSCSPVGPGGMIGCQEQLIRQAQAERGGAEIVNWNRLIEEARQERLSRIDAAAQADEEDAGQVVERPN